MRTKKIKNVLILSCIGLALNIACKNLMLLFGLPLYLDCMGTVLVSALCGIVPGMIVGFITDLFASITDPFSIYFVSISALVALIAGFASERGMLKKPAGIAAVWIGLVLVSGVMGSFLTWTLNGGQISSTAAFIAIPLLGAGWAPMAAQMTGDVLINAADKALTLIPIVLFLRAYPKKLFGAFPNSYIYEGDFAPTRPKAYRQSVKNKLNAIICVSAFTIGLAVALFSWYMIITVNPGEASTYLIKVISIDLGLALIIAAGASLFVNAKILYNLDLILDLIRKFGHSDKLTWLDSPEWKNHEPVRSDDELEEIYQALCESQASVVHAAQIEHAQEEKLAEAYETAQKASAAKTDFLSAMSHDIRTPMNAITGMVDIALRNEDNPQKLHDSLKKIQSSSDQLVTLVNDVLDISAIESGRIGIKPADFNVPAAFDQYYSLFRTMADNNKLAYTLNVHDISNPWVDADELRIRQIFVNIISNAMKYTPAGGTVSVEAYQETDASGVLQTIGIVSDNGIGMSEEFLAHIWDSFTRATDTRINKIQGAGLGTNIVKGLVDLMGGTIEVTSALNEGSTFKVTLPLTPVEHSDAGDNELDPMDNPLNATVLLAEDNDMNWEIAEELLSMSGVTCTRAENGQICLNLFTEAPVGTYDAILMDMQMPVMGGIEATMAIRASQHPEAKTIPIIAMTANAFTDDIERCLQAGMNDHMSKPIDIKKVVATLRKYLK